MFLVIMAKYSDNASLSNGPDLFLDVLDLVRPVGRNVLAEVEAAYLSGAPPMADASTRRSQMHRRLRRRPPSASTTHASLTSPMSRTNVIKALQGLFRLLNPRRHASAFNLNLTMLNMFLFWIANHRYTQ